ncbi:hypothetical protein [Enterococcus sp. AD013-P3]|uniref:hypothetical protein n=1 Tax=Enterococcus sp. AD013-P3 TaxID=3411036 RepID=UPI003B9591F4
MKQRYTLDNPAGAGMVCFVCGLIANGQTQRDIRQKTGLTFATIVKIKRENQDLINRIKEEMHRGI